MTPRLYFDGSLAEAVQVELDDAAAHHATTVLRLRSDDEIELFNGDGWRYRARLQLQRRGRAGARIERRYRADTDSGIDVLLAQAVATADKMDWVIEKAVELGVSAIQPIAAARSLARLDAARAERRQTHWQRVIVAACMQCGRDRLPTLSAVQPLAPWLAGRAPGAAAASAGEPAGAAAVSVRLQLLLSPAADRSLADAVDAAPGQRRFALLVGPESGFAAEEQRLAEQTGWQPVSLGPRTLRTETAGLAAIAALQALRGDFSSGYSLRTE